MDGLFGKIDRLFSVIRSMAEQADFITVADIECALNLA